jgi:hypothetical protein
LVVLDVDTTRGGDKNLADMAMPPTRTVRTPSGGFHYYFRYPEAERVGCIPDIFPGVDLKGDGGYVLCPPSTIDGHPYAVTNDVEPTEMPDWLRDVTRHRTRRTTLLGRGVIGAVLGAERGERNNKATSIAGSLLSRYPQADWENICWPLLVAWNRNNAEPLSEEELRRAFESVGQMEQGSRPRQVLPYERWGTAEDMLTYPAPKPAPVVHGLI